MTQQSPMQLAEISSVSLAFLGSGGAGVISTGELLLEAACKNGWYGLLTRSVGPQIRGGEAAAMLRLATQPVDCHADRFDLLVAVDWLNAQRFALEMPLGPRTIALCDPESGAVPEFVRAAGVRVIELPLKAMTAANPEWRPNMIALGAALRVLGLPEDAARAAIENRFGDKGAAVIVASLAAVKGGADAVESGVLPARLPAPAASGTARWRISGNQAVGLGAVRGGVRFAAAYPITPATEILEWLALNLAKVGGALVQAEDELASINMIIGGSYAGAPSITATSGPGLSLMVEGIGLATAAEVPIVVVDVMRGGPSTGIPTKSEQSDLNIALYGMHGDAPHIVVAPQSVSDCVFTAQWATYLAEAMQIPVLLLSDQFMGQAHAAIDRPADVAFVGQRRIARDIAGTYRRYSLNGPNVTAMALPGTPGGQYTADGLSHSERGTPSSAASDHRAQLDKRANKVHEFDFGDHWATLHGSGEIAVLTWGSVTGAVLEGIALARTDGIDVRVIAPRLLLPAQPERMAAALGGVRELIVIEQSHGAQFYRYLRAHYHLPRNVRVVNSAGPLPLRPGDIYRELTAERAA